MRCTIDSTLERTERDILLESSEPLRVDESKECFSGFEAGILTDFGARVRAPETMALFALAEAAAHEHLGILVRAMKAYRFSVDRDGHGNYCQCCRRNTHPTGDGRDAYGVMINTECAQLIHRGKLR